MLRSMFCWPASWPTVYIRILIMAFSKLLLLKALSTLQKNNMKGERGGGKKNNDTNISLRLCTCTWIYQCTVTFVSFPLSPPPHPHPHTYTHTHTHTQQIGRYELIRFIKVEEIDLKVSIGVAFLMCTGNEFQTEGQSTITCPLVLMEWQKL